MRLLKARFRNWCQHKDTVMDFSDGLNAVRGPNGSGKSNALTGIVFGLTGDFSRNPGVKVDNIYQLAGDKERAGITLDLVHGPTKLTIERNLRPNSQKLIVEGEKNPITKADEINAKIQEILGVNERLLLDYVFVDQWKIFSFVDQSPGVRAKAFGELFNAAKADTLWKTLGDYKINVPVPSIDGDRVRVRIAEVQEEIRQIQKELTEYSDLPEKWKYEEDPLSKTVQNYGFKIHLKRTIEQYEQAIDKTKDSIVYFLNQLRRPEDELFKQREKLTSIIKDVEQAQTDIASWSAYETADKARAMIENEVCQLTKELEAKCAPIPDVGYCGHNYREPEEKLASYRADLIAMEKLLRTFDTKSGVGACPTCGTPALQLEHKLREAVMQVPILRQNIASLSDLIARSKAYDTAISQYSDWVSRTKENLHTAKVRLMNLGEVRQPTKDREQQEAILNEYAVITRYISTKEREITGIQKDLAQLDGKLMSLDNELSTRQSEYDSINITEDQFTEAQAQLASKQERYGQRNNLRCQLDVKMRALADDEAALQKFQFDERKAVKLRHTVSHLDDVRTVFKELPQVAAQACLDSMVEDINDVLEKFDAPFRVQNVDNLKFTLRKHSGVITSAERLSGGEKAVFALAFRIIVNSRFAGSLGLLCLDEPTAGLDEDNIACLEVALGRLREFSTSRGLQVILITHETGLDSLFDRVIKLSPAH